MAKKKQNRNLGARRCSNEVALSREGRVKIYEEYGGCCACCGRGIAYKSMLLLPVSQGGRGGKTLFVPLCEKCWWENTEASR